VRGTGRRSLRPRLAGTRPRPGSGGRYRQTVDDVRRFLDGAEAFFEAFAAVAWGALALAVFFHVLKLVLRVRGWQNILRASYPGSHVPFGSVFGGYVAGVGVNSIVPARGGDLVKLYLVHQRMPGSSYPTLGSTLVVETLFDFVVASGLFFTALALGLLPGVPDLPALPAFDWSFLVEHPRVAAFLGAVLLGGAIIAAAWAARRVVAFKEKVALGFAALHDRRAFLRGVVFWQALSWLSRVACVFFFLRAFHVDATLETTVAVLVVQGLSTVLPFTPGGAGTQQAVLAFALGGAAARSTVLAFSFGMQLVTVIVNVVLGFGAIAIMLRTLSWRRVLHLRRGELAEETPNGEPADAPSRSALPG
jgi:uncharacterized membrane protein YbhN (UPF0104 family)